MTFLILSIQLLHAGGEAEETILDRPSSSGSDSTIVYELDVADDRNAKVVDSIQMYDLSLRLADEYYSILDNYQDKIWLEVHAGICQEIRFDSSRWFTGPMIGLRLNLLEPKIPQPGKLLSRIYTFDGLVTQYGVVLEPKDRDRIDTIRRELERYTDSGYFKRLGIGVSFPYAVTEEKGELFDGTRYLYTYFLFDRPYIFVAYDPVDFLSFNAGVNIYLESAFFGLSFDISTPVRTAFRGFNEWLKELVGLGYGP